MRRVAWFTTLVFFLGACDQEAPSNLITPELRSLAADYTSAWNSGDPAAVAGYYALDGTLTINGGEPAVGRAGVEAVAASFMESFPDMRLTNDRLEAVNGRINYHWTFVGTNSGPPGTGNAVDFSGYESWIVGEDGLVNESIGTFDATEYRRQLFAQPPALLALGAELFPADLSLRRAEDGVALADGSLLVVDQEVGLRRILADGSSAPFGEMQAAGYGDPELGHEFAANGISLEPAGTHVLVADVYGGGIYRVSLSDGATEKIYQHQYGVNTAIRDSSGAVWFTQSAHNMPAYGEAGMMAALDKPLVQGAVLRLPPDAGSTQSSTFGSTPEVVVDGLQFANGLALDEASGVLYVAESVAERVLKYSVDVDAGTLADVTVLVDGVFPDNIELDDQGNLWIASPIPNNVLILNPETGASRWLIEGAPTRDALISDWRARTAAGESRLALMTPDAWAPMPGFLTGMIFAGDRVFLTGLSNTLVAVSSPVAGP